MTGLPGPTRAAYEAGPTGFALARALTVAGVDCVVAAPGKIERPSADRVKTDQRDAERLVRLLMIDALVPVRVPTGEEEAIRDLVRAREDLRGDLMRARHRLSKLLLRHDVRYEDTSSTWNDRHRSWLARVDLGERGAQATMCDYTGAIDALIIRRDSLEATIARLIPGSPLEHTVARLRCLRGIDTLSAVGLAAEVGDFARFERPAQLMSYLGLVPSKHTTGEKRRQGAITKTGSRHARRLSSRPPGITANRRAAGPRSPVARTGSQPRQSRFPGRPSSGCTSSGVASMSSAASAARSSQSPSPGTSPGSVGRSSPPTTSTQPRDPSRRSRSRRRQTRGPSRARAPTANHKHPARRSRSSLDSELSRRNPVLRHPTREYQSDRASRTRHGCRPLDRNPHPDQRRPKPTAPSTLPPYQLCENAVRLASS